jgi:hypothetical protein
MNPFRLRALIVTTGLALTLGIGTAAAFAAAGDDADRPALPAEPDGGIGDTPIPVEPDGGIGDTPIPVEPDGGIGDTPDDRYAIELARDQAHGLLGRYESDLPADVRVARRGTEHLALTEDYVLGRFTVELDDEGDGYRVTSVTIELPDGPETVVLTPG